VTRYRTRDGGRVDVITLTGTSPAAGRALPYGDNGDGQWLRVTGPAGNHVGQVRTPAELPALGIDLASLTLAT